MGKMKQLFEQHPLEYGPEFPRLDREMLAQMSRLNKQVTAIKKILEGCKNEK
tara:strand:+ start:77 stop:232 length:156 start_codon:yes stop_codon:yes gene_type:complete